MDGARIVDSKHSAVSFDAAKQEARTAMLGRDRQSGNSVSRMEGEVASAFFVTCAAVAVAAYSWRMELGSLAVVQDPQLMSVFQNHMERKCRVFDNGVLHITLVSNRCFL